MKFVASVLEKVSAFNKPNCIQCSNLALLQGQDHDGI